MDLSYHHNVLAINNADGTFEISTLFGSEDSVQSNLRSMKWRAAVREAYGATNKLDLHDGDGTLRGNFYRSDDGTITCTTIVTRSPLRVVEAWGDALMLNVDGRERSFSLTSDTPYKFTRSLTRSRSR